MTIFISHSSRDNSIAASLCEWLMLNGWGQHQIFLDLHDLHTGDHWRARLNEMGNTCEAVIACLSDNWLTSPECIRELNYAEFRGKPIFPVKIAPLSVTPPAFVADLQICDISTADTADKGYENLLIGLRTTRIAPNYYRWPPKNEVDRSPFRGMKALDEVDAGILFGRDKALIDSLDSLRRLRETLQERLFVIIAASGAGKSSFLRAGLMARLRRDNEQFLVLPVVRPERLPLSGPHGLLASLSVAVPSLDALRLQDVFSTFRSPAIEKLSRYSQATGHIFSSKEPTIIIPIDQFEEVFSATREIEEARQFLYMLARILSEEKNLIVIATMRSDSYYHLQNCEELTSFPRALFDLPQVDSAMFKEIIEAPGRLATPPIEVEPALTEQLLRDLRADDALPLLAFTLERLAEGRPRPQRLTLEHYGTILGGLDGAIQAATNAAFNAALSDTNSSFKREELEIICRDLFIPHLVQLDDVDASPKRLVSRWTELSEHARWLAKHFVQQRVLVSHEGGVEIAHEAILRRWPKLEGWIADVRDELVLRASIIRARRDWLKQPDPQKKGDLLLHRGARLRDAKALVQRDNWAHFLSNCQDYLNACRDRDEHDLAEIEIRDRINIVQRQRLLAATCDILRREGRCDGAMRVGLCGDIDEQAVKKGVGNDPVRYAQLARAAHESRFIAKCAPHPSAIPCLDYRSDGLLIGTGAQDGVVRILEADTGNLIQELPGHHGWVNGLRFFPNGRALISVGRDKALRVWNLETYNCDEYLVGPDELRCVDIDPTERFVGAGLSNGTILLWELSNLGKQPLVLAGHEHGRAVLGVSFSADGSCLASGGQDLSLRVWSTKSREQIWVRENAHSAFIDEVDFSPCSHHVVSAGWDDSAYVWNIADDSKRPPFVRLSGHSEQVRSVAYSPDGLRIATASGDSTVRVWSAATGKQLSLMSGHDGWIQSIVFAPSGCHLATSGYDGTVRIWEVASGDTISALRELRGNITAVAFSPSADQLVAGGPEDGLRIFHARTGELEANFSDLVPNLHRVEFSPGGDRILAASTTGEVLVLSSVDGKVLKRFDGHTSTKQVDPLQQFNPIAFSNDGECAFATDAEGSICVWAIMGNGPATLRKKYLGAQNAPSSIAMSRDGRFVASVDFDGQLNIWSTDECDGPQYIFASGLRSVRRIAFDPGSERLALGGTVRKLDQGYEVRIWRIGETEPYFTLAAHTDEIWDVAFSADGSRIVTGCRDRHVRVFDSSTGVLTGDYFSSEQIQAVGIERDNNLIVGTGRRGLARVMDSVFSAALQGPELPIAIARERLRGSGDLTPQEIDRINEYARAPNSTGAWPNLTVQIESQFSSCARLKQLQKINDHLKRWRDHRVAAYEYETSLLRFSQSKAADASS